jgi:hypothetical protein
MPSIEIACIGLESPLEPPPTSFAVAYEGGLKSHRSPCPRFQSQFDQLSGSLYHLGNPGFAGTKAGPFFAYDLLSEASRHAESPSFLEFAPEHEASVRELLSWLLQVSPQSKLLFTSDWQFGPGGSRTLPQASLNEFWRLHSQRRLLLNAAYPLTHAA